MRTFNLSLATPTAQPTPEAPQGLQIWSLLSNNDAGITCSLHNSREAAEIDQMACIQEYAADYYFIDFDRDYQSIIDALESENTFIDSYAIQEHNYEP